MAEDQAVDINRLGRAQATIGTVNRNILPKNEDNSGQSEIAIIEGLSSDKYLKQVHYSLLGYTYNYITEKWEKIREPVMNEDGIGNFMAVCIGLKKVDFSYYDADEIPSRVYHFFDINYTHFIINEEKFELKKEDRNIISSILFFYADAILKGAKGAGNRNVIRATLSEGVVSKLFEGGNNSEKKGLGAWLKNKLGVGSK